MIRPSNSGTATWVAASSGRQPVVAGRPRRARLVVRHRPCRIGTSSAASAPTSQASSSPPALTPRRAGAARREHGDDQGVRGARACRSSSGSAGAQRGAEHRQRAGRRRPRRACRARRRRRCSRELVGPVVEDGRRPGRRSSRSTSRAARSRIPHDGQLDGRVEALAGEQHRVGEEGVQLAEVGRAALGQVGVRLGGDARRAPSTAPSARRPGPARRRARPPAGRPRSTASSPSCQARRAAEDPDDDDVGAVQQGGQLSGGGAGRVGEPVVRAATRGRRAGRCPRWTAAGRPWGCLPPDPRRAGGCAACGAVSWLPDRRAPRPSGRAPVAVGGVCSPVTVAGPLRIRTGFLAAARRMELSVPATLRSATTARQAL